MYSNFYTIGEVIANNHPQIRTHLAPKLELYPYTKDQSHILSHPSLIKTTMLHRVHQCIKKIPRIYVALNTP